MAWTYLWNRNSPPDTGESASLGATRIRQFKEALFERFTNWIYSCDGADAETDYGLKHAPLKVQGSAPAAVADKILLYGKDVSAKCELFARDEDGDEIQLTSGGAINVPASFTVGMIILWSGSIASIPSGWALCNGSSGTPDLRDKFVVGAGSTYAVAATGGAATAQLTTNELPAHTHTFTDNGYPNAYSSAGGGGGLSGVNTITGTTASAGSGAAFSILPPYYALAYIMYTS